MSEEGNADVLSLEMMSDEVALERADQVDELPAIDAYAPEPAPIQRRRAGNLAGAWRFFRDPNASLLGKAFVVLAIVYVISPIDLIPDVAPVIGWIDDLIVLIVAMTYLFRRAQKYR